MAAHPVPPPDDFASRPLGPRDGPATWRFLNAGGIRNVFIASQVWRGALSQKSADGTPELWGSYSGEELRAVLFYGQGGLAVPAAATAEDITALGPVLARRAERLRALIGSLDLVDALLPFVEAAGARARVRVRELFLEVDATTLDPASSLPDLRLATLDDLDLVTRASSRAHLEEMGEDPFARNPEAFLGRVARMILEERVYVLREADTLVFKAELSALCPLGAQISGVYTDPPQRNRGIARRGTVEITRRVLEATPAVCLFVREDNPPALRAYERGGFRHLSDYRTLFFEDPSGPRRLRVESRASQWPPSESPRADR
jgi:GNAT superfamily N-acetyltransferase